MSQPDYNPYESPRDPNLPTNQFGDRSEAELAELRRRVFELERRLGRNWLVHSNWLVRSLGVWAYFILGYMMLGALVVSVMAVIWLITGQWPS